MPYLSKKEIIGLLNGDDKTKVDIANRLDILKIKCQHCGKVFIKSTKNMKYCEDCKRISYDNKVGGIQKEKRNEYKKMYARMMRGKITKEQFEEWKMKSN